ncbi:fumarylacetoacetate hydrolase family protein [Paenibacillaceae bacterium WGS1546]|uniref:fumarylacetoacetate hydrolase family protein n=1 Tax=Cohnella sp. WGS1546 TaxID=3366810 RepID=UPI00372D488D
MKLVHLHVGDRLSAGVATPDGIVDLGAAARAVPPDVPIPDTVDGLIAGGAEAKKALDRYLDKLCSQPDIDTAAYFVDEKSAKWGPCVGNPQKIICIGLNYRKHAEETNAPIPQTPVVFGKFNNTLTGHLSDVTLPIGTDKLDYEAELAIVIGKQADHVGREEALSYVFGYATANDLSARDWQLLTSQWLMGKTGNGFCPIGPYLVTADEVPDPNALDIRLTVNGEERQNSRTSDMIFYCDEIISYLSRHMTLLPGDVILTGTPEGVVLGYPKEKQAYLKPGDVVTVEIEGLGSLTNRIV